MICLSGAYKAFMRFKFGTMVKLFRDKSIDEAMQKRTYFFYGEDEKAYKSCYKLVQKAYPYANYRIEKGHGHMTYSCEYTDEYVDWLQAIIEAT